MEPSHTSASRVVRRSNWLYDTLFPRTETLPFLVPHLGLACQAINSGSVRVTHAQNDGAREWVARPALHVQRRMQSGVRMCGSAGVICAQNSKLQRDNSRG